MGDTDSKHINPCLAQLGVRRAVKDEDDLRREAGKESGKVATQSRPVSRLEGGEDSHGPRRHLQGEAVGGLATGARAGWVSLRENIQNETRKGQRMKH